MRFCQSLSRIVALFLCSTSILIATALAQDANESFGRGDSRTVQSAELPMSSAQKIQAIADTLAHRVAWNLTASGSHRIAVMTLTTLRGEETDLGQLISNKLTSALSTLGGPIEVVERSKITEALSEMKLGETGVLSNETIQQAGQALGADAVVVGTATDIGSEIDIDVRVVSVQSLKILSSANELLAGDESIKKLNSTTLPRIESLTRQAGASIVFDEDFAGGDYSHLVLSGKSRGVFNPEAGVLEVNGGNNRNLVIQFSIEGTIDHGLVEVDFTPTKIHPESGSIQIWALTGSNNGYCFGYPISVYASFIGSVVSKVSSSLVSRKGDRMALNTAHHVSFKIAPTSIQGICDGKVIHSVPRNDSYRFCCFEIRLSQMNAYVDRITVSQ